MIITEVHVNKVTYSYDIFSLKKEFSVCAAQGMLKLASQSCFSTYLVLLMSGNAAALNGKLFKEPLTGHCHFGHSPTSQRAQMLGQMKLS